MTEIKQYSERDAMELDGVGGYYFRHVLAMTAEGLHSKSDIAAELGWRDMQIAALQEQVRALAAENAAVKSYLNDGGIGIEISMGETHAFIREIRAQGAIDARNALVVAGDGADIYAVVTDVAARIRAGDKP
ncbi:hypothetical protein JNO12_12620 [Erwinia aphidicola]|nr:hypothetical protein [Erwinia aphidicola]